MGRSLLCETQQKDKQEDTNCFHDSIPLNTHLQIACSEIWRVPSRLCPYIAHTIDFPIQGLVFAQLNVYKLRNVNTDVYLLNTLKIGFLRKSIYISGEFSEPSENAVGYM